MTIRINQTEFASLKFYKGEIEISGEIRHYQVTLDQNSDDKRKKINFYAEGAKFTEVEKTEILMSFNEMLGQQINEDNLGE